MREVRFVATSRLFTRTDKNTYHEAPPALSIFRDSSKKGSGLRMKPSVFLRLAAFIFKCKTPMPVLWRMWAKTLSSASNSMSNTIGIIRKRLRACTYVPLFFSFFALVFPRQPRSSPTSKTTPPMGLLSPFCT